ncbi:dihydrolipoamide acetyltransferase family protein [Virgibacillus oceani]|uniref:Dihydrolipoamide acetyltransferase component of pyruvate dehydrogenase complex n=1 Tax=Virgibacillus oceani TaxID=1479511 RepID=A0A917M2R9_9BACI|nr:dihydrolipoamide acetyltransferase family protein [Virgibacillus oceani]GGG73564.1 dihydrolipoamide acetyltransferase component of pyruvate dehydrogenase complex [Virgibacillus oceani]
MAKEVFMPKLSSTMEVGTLLQWFKEEGESVEIGEPLFEIMTDKINIEVESYEEGTLLKKYYQLDDEIPVNTVIAYIGEESEAVPKDPPVGNDQEGSMEERESSSTTEATETESNVKESQSNKVRATPSARRVARENEISLHSIQGSGPKGRIQEQDVAEMVSQTETKLSTPLAEKIAKDKGINLHNVQGTGSRNKITKADVIGHDTASSDEPERIQLKGLRKAVAAKMLESARSIPHVTLTTDVDMTKAMEMRQALLPIIEEQTGYRLSYTEIIMKTTAHVLGSHPYVNASLIENEIILNKSVHLGLAVAVENGLIVPSIQHAEAKGLAELTVMSKTLGKKARNNQLTPEEMSGSTFTISNLGMYAIDGFTPIINPPETAILGVGRIVRKPVAIDNAMEIRPMMVLSLSFDHRAIDGAPAAAFLTELKECLESPYGLLV